jgi:hypothetical protein
MSRRGLLRLGPISAIVGLGAAVVATQWINWQADALRGAEHLRPARPADIEIIVYPNVWHGQFVESRTRPGVVINHGRLPVWFRYDPLEDAGIPHLWVYSEDGRHPGECQPERREDRLIPPGGSCRVKYCRWWPASDSETASLLRRLREQESAR